MRDSPLRCAQGDEKPRFAMKGLWMGALDESSSLMRKLYVYVLSSDTRELYIGVTNNLQLRVDTHRNDGSRFTAARRIHRLVYYELIGPPIAAITREKQLKVWKRSKKIALIESVNPNWDELAPSSSP